MLLGPSGNLERRNSIAFSVQMAVKQSFFFFSTRESREEKKKLYRNAQHPGSWIVSGAISRVFSRERERGVLTRDSCEFFARRRARSFREMAISEGSLSFETRDKSRATTRRTFISLVPPRWSTFHPAFLFSVGCERPLFLAIPFW